MDATSLRLQADGMGYENKPNNDILKARKISIGRSLSIAFREWNITCNVPADQLGDFTIFAWGRGRIQCAEYDKAREISSGIRLESWRFRQQMSGLPSNPL